MQSKNIFHGIFGEYLFMDQCAYTYIHICSLPHSLFLKEPSDTADDAHDNKIATDEEPCAEEGDNMTEEINDVDPEAANYVEAVIKALELSDGEILLGVAWTTKDGYLNHKRFPNILGVNITFGTNNEKRPLLRVIGKNARNKNLPFIDAFLPSMQRYVFSWFFREAVPYLLDNEALLDTSLILTDQDIHMLEALYPIINAIDSKYGNAVHRLCKWHKVSLFAKNLKYAYVHIHICLYAYIHICVYAHYHKLLNCGPSIPYLS